jgi:hypothetical protein
MPRRRCRKLSSLHKHHNLSQNGCKCEGSVPGREGEVVVFVGVVDRSLNVDDNWVAARDFGGNVNGHDGEHGVAADGGGEA